MAATPVLSGDAWSTCLGHDDTWFTILVEVLDIPDDYEFMDPALIELIQASVEPMLVEASE